MAGRDPKRSVWKKFCRADFRVARLQLDSQCLRDGKPTKRALRAQRELPAALSKRARLWQLHEEKVRQGRLRAAICKVIYEAIYEEKEVAERISVELAEIEDREGGD